MSPPVGSVLLHPAPSEEHPGRPQGFNDPASTRLIAVSTQHPWEWPWRRLTGLPSEVPAQGSDLSGWRPQPLLEVATVLGRP